MCFSTHSQILLIIQYFQFENVAFLKPILIGNNTPCVYSYRQGYKGEFDQSVVVKNLKWAMDGTGIPIIHQRLKNKARGRPVCPEGNIMCTSIALSALHHPLHGSKMRGRKLGGRVAVWR
ncbi:hypothetical protein XELAEV_18038574mg [Xenopus laevis]|uniref:Uncharacterized protein n=1 Tax=Xenopus laevis TaxID=8355 RepID=A0A974C5Z5_XENLA|nr:hypothetical protein XELAEV_18038574mg [Xenopus laevis]